MSRLSLWAARVERQRVTLPVVHLIAAARPNFMKVAPLHHALAAAGWCRPQLVHTGQHYDANMSDAFLRDLGLPEPAHHLEVGSGSHAEQTGRTMIAYEAVCRSASPAAIVVVGDVNATVACALVGAKLWIPVVHLEAGLRSGDRRMPEEINRLVTDAVADLLWTPSRDADANLRAEGVPAAKIECVGNIMLDSFELLRERISAADTRARLKLDGPYAVVTLHRPSNVDDRTQLEGLVGALVALSQELTVVFAVHPRTRKRLAEFGLASRIAAAPAIRSCGPLSYIDFMSLVMHCTIALTDSGGVQEETTYLGIPCGTLRENTERPITLTEGTNRLVSAATLLSSAREALAGQWPRGRRPELWDGHAAGRAADSLRRRLRG
ncbi:MAG: UDP-N-acetylglucosamine 2-epimerase (non-hydrolyzing) [Gammaproteobacteria bacterium]|nr:UDP-N-acetylglucosamine 2-epimerase (non-hydrolyzing) [Gammaproteobacteria bacterium]